MKFWRLLLFPVCVLVFFAVARSDVYAASSSWADPAKAFSIGEEPYDPNNKVQPTCVVRQNKIPRFDFSFPWAINSDGTVNLDVARFSYYSNSSYCALASKIGFITENGGYLSSTEDGATVPLYYSGNEGFSIVPGEANKAVMYQNSSVIGKNVSVINNLTGNIKPFNRSGELVFKVYDPPAYLKNNDNTLTNFNGFRFSRNGKYMIARMSNGSLARFDLNTLEMTPIAYYPDAFGAPDTFTISNDGRYVFLGNGGFTIYDLAGCQTKYTQNQWPQSLGRVTLYPGCQSATDNNQIMNKYHYNVDPYASSGSAVFDMDGQRVRYVIRWVTNGVAQWKLIVVKSADFVQTNGYLAMGDSFASGEGDNGGKDWYESPTDLHQNDSGDENLCHLSRRSYPYLTARTLGIIEQLSGSENFRSVACSGAVYRNVIGGHGIKSYQTNDRDNQYNFANLGLGNWQPGFTSQISYVTGFDYSTTNIFKEPFHPDTITISIGGNDLGFADYIKKCAMPGTCEEASPTNVSARSRLAIQIGELKSNLTMVYRELQDSAPATRIYVLGYPQFLSYNEQCGINVHLDSSEKLMIRNSVIYANKVIKAAADEAGVYYVDVEDILEDRNLCSGAADAIMAVNGLTKGDDLFLNLVGKESFHPNENAQPLFSTRLLTKTTGLNAPMPVPAKTLIPLPDLYFGQSSISYINSLNSSQATTQARPEYKGVVVGQTTSSVTVEGLDFAPNTTVSVEVRSTPQTLGSFTTDQNGAFKSTVNLPNNLEPGYHEIHLMGVTFTGEKIDKFQNILVASNNPNDTDGDGIPNDQDKCLFVEQANQDYDKDGIDDGCDGFIAEPPKDITPPTVTGTTSEQPNANGWYNHDVSINWQSVDTGYHEGEPTQPASTTADQEGEHAYTSGQSCDSANNCATGSQTIKIDRTAPTITANTDRQANANGWFNGPVTVNFECSDSLSSIESCPTPITVSEENANHIITGTALDKAGNSSTVNLYLKIDLSVPTINYSLSNQPNAAGWYNNDVTVSFNCEDSLSGVVECPAPFLVSGGNQTILRDVSDLAGNKASLSVDIKQDKLAPIVTLAMSSQANSLGWFNQPVTLTPTCSDDLSGIKICPEPVIVSTDSLANLLEFSAEDNAGNHSSIQTIIKLDTTKPKITYLASPSPNSSGWHNTSYVVSFTCSDELSGIATCPSSQTVSTNDQITATATDNAGNSTSVVIQPKIDTSAPSIQPLLGSAANVNGWFNEPVTISFNCSDDLSGIGTCQSPITVGAEGSILVGGTASDLAGNSASVNVLVKLDSTAPTLTPIYSIQPNSSGVFSGPVTVSFACTDILSGIAVCPAPITVSTTGNTSISATAKDYAGNSYAWTKTITIQSPQTSCTIQLALQGKCNPKELTQCKSGSWPKAVCNALGIWFELLIKLYGLYRP